MIPVKDLVGIPYRHHGRDSAGMDCYGLVIEVLKRIGKNLPDVFYPDTEIETNKTILKNLEEIIPNTKLEKPEEGAVVIGNGTAVPCGRVSRRRNIYPFHKIMRGSNRKNIAIPA